MIASSAFSRATREDVVAGAGAGAGGLGLGTSVDIETIEPMLINF